MSSVFCFVLRCTGISERNLDWSAPAALFSSTACDQIMEQTFNRDSKTKGGITGFSLNKNAVKRWILSQSQRGSITHQCRTLAGLDTTDRFVSRKCMSNSNSNNNQIDSAYVASLIFLSFSFTLETVRN